MDANPPVVQKQDRRTILVSGNNTNAQATVTLLLQRFKYNVSIVQTAAEAFESAATIHPALIITDLSGSGASDLALFDKLRSDKRTASIPVIVMVSASDAAGERRSLDYGAAACITKPIQAEELYQTVQAIVERRPRVNIRIALKVPVSVDNVPLEFCEKACEIGLSEEGMYLPTSKPQARNKRIKVALHIKDRVISVEGAVLYMNAPDARPGVEPGMGVKFVSIAPEDQAFIRQFIHDEITQDDLAAQVRDNSTFNRN